MNAIRELRFQTGMSQKEFAEYVEIPVGTIQHWEQGFRKPPEYVVKLIKRLMTYDSWLVAEEVEK